MNEIFKDIKGYEGKYQVSNTGKVKSLPKGDGNGNRERILKPEVTSKPHTNYHRISLSQKGVVKRFFIHRLVGVAFIPNPLSKPYINHIDNNGKNNVTTNLEWVTHSENMIHSQKQGRLFATQSKAGIAGGKVRTTKVNLAVLTKIGKYFGDWKVLKSAGKKGVRQNMHLTCECSCGVLKDISMSSLDSGKSQRCKSCALRKYHKSMGRKPMTKVIVAITQADHNGNTLNTFSSIQKASAATGFTGTSINRWIRIGYAEGQFIWTREKFKI